MHGAEGGPWEPCFVCLEWRSGDLTYNGDILGGGGGGWPHLIPCSQKDGKQHLEDMIPGLPSFSCSRGHSRIHSFIQQVLTESAACASHGRRRRE